MSFGEVGIQVDGCVGILDGLDIALLPDEGLGLAGIQVCRFRLDLDRLSLQQGSQQGQPAWTGGTLYKDLPRTASSWPWQAQVSVHSL